MRTYLNTTVGDWFIRKYRYRAIETNDYGAVARQLRKQGVPFEIARLILVGR